MLIHIYIFKTIYNASIWYDANAFCHIICEVSLAKVYISIVMGVSCWEFVTTVRILQHKLHNVGSRHLNDGFGGMEK